MNIKKIVVIGGSIIASFGIGFALGEKFTKKKADRRAQINAQMLIGKVLKKEANKRGVKVNVVAPDEVIREIRKSNMEEKKEQIARAWEEEEKAKVKEIQEENGYSDEEPSETNEMNIDEYMASHEHPDEDTDDDEVSTVVKDIHPEDYIFVIDVDEYENEYEYDHVEITYYEEDRVFCDESEKRIEDPEQIFGKNVDDLFGRNPVNPDDVIFIKNTWFENVYQITRIHNAYSRVVLGIEDEYPIN